MDKIYYKDIDLKEGMFGMLEEQELFIITKDKIENRFIAIYQAGGYDYIGVIFRERKIKYIETTPLYNSFQHFKYAIEDSTKGKITGVSEVVYTKTCDESTLEMLKKWRKEIEEEINKREKQ